MTGFHQRRKIREEVDAEKSRRRAAMPPIPFDSEEVRRIDRDTADRVMRVVLAQAETVRHLVHLVNRLDERLSALEGVGELTQTMADPEPSKPAEPERRSYAFLEELGLHESVVLEEIHGPTSSRRIGASLSQWGRKLDRKFSLRAVDGGYRIKRVK